MGPARQRVITLVSLVVATVACALVLHVVLILYTGGYGVAVHAYGLRIAGHGVTRPIILVLGLLILLRLARHGGFTRATATLSGEAAILFAATLMVYLANGRTLGAGDTLGARYLPFSILRERNFNLDEFTFLHQSPFVTTANGHYVSPYPIGAALLALPFYLASALGRVDAQSPLVDELEKLSAATIVALSVVVFYLTLRWLTSRPGAIVITTVYAVGTSSLSVSSQALWQHAPSQLALTATLYCLVRGRGDDRWVAFAGLPLAFAVISRPTDLLLAVPLCIYVLVHHRTRILGFILGGLGPLVLQFWYNSANFGNPYRMQFSRNLKVLTRRFWGGTEPWSTPLLDGLSGILWSPSRGLFVYTAIFLLSVVGIVLAWRKGGDRLIRYASVGVVFNVLVYSKWYMWWGGYTYGPRMLADLTPVLALALYPVLALRGSVGRALKVVFVVLAAWSIGAHSIGAFVDDGSWDGKVDVDHFPERLWLWTDNPLINPVQDAITATRTTLRGAP